MHQESFDLVVIGAGPGGYVAAIRAAQLGSKVALVEANDLGGTCLNVGCIPTKALLSCAKAATAVQEAHEFGIDITSFSLNYAKMKQRKDSIVEKMRSSLESLIQSNKIEIISGRAKLVSPHEVKIEHNSQFRLLQATNIILATGSGAREVAPFRFDFEKIHSSTSILDITTLPKVLVIVGGGYIGCEFACLFQALGVKIIIIEALHRLLAQENETASAMLHETFVSKGAKIYTQTRVSGVETDDDCVTITLESGEKIQADQCLVAIGRQLNTQNLGLESVGVFVSDKGFIPVNDRMQTNIEHIYAIGDITAKSMLAHCASHQGEVAAYNACGQDKIMHYDAIPAVIFTDPEIASVGYTLEKALSCGLQAYKSQFPLQAIGKAQAISKTQGFAELVVETKTQRILGALLVGHEAGNLIASMTLAIQNELTVECVVATIHAHPTLAEAWHETALVALGTPLHIPARKQAR